MTRTEQLDRWNELELELRQLDRDGQFSWLRVMALAELVIQTLTVVGGVYDRNAAVDWRSFGERLFEIDPELAASVQSIAEGYSAALKRWATLMNAELAAREN